MFARTRMLLLRFCPFVRILLGWATVPLNASFVQFPVYTFLLAKGALRFVFLPEGPESTDPSRAVAHDRGLCRRGGPRDSDLSAIFRVRHFAEDEVAWEWGRSRHDRGRGRLPGSPCLSRPWRLSRGWLLDCVSTEGRVSDFPST
jgi:hypothetical protein